LQKIWIIQEIFKTKINKSNLFPFMNNQQKTPWRIRNQRNFPIKGTKNSNYNFIIKFPVVSNSHHNSHYANVLESLKAFMDLKNHGWKSRKISTPEIHRIASESMSYNSRNIVLKNSYQNFQLNRVGFLIRDQKEILDWVFQQALRSLQYAG
jgi:hypothetical protein